MSRDSLLVRNLLFLLGLAGTYGLFILLAVNDVNGLRGPARADNPFVREHQSLGDTVDVVALGMVALAMSVARKRLHVPSEVLGGIWAALVLAVAVILFA